MKNNLMKQANDEMSEENKIVFVNKIKIMTYVLKNFFIDYIFSRV